jgi:uncharacterized metal-binding protein
MYKVIVNLSTGSHYDCATIAEANEVFCTAPIAESGDRILTVDGVIVRREFLDLGGLDEK